MVNAMMLNLQKCIFLNFYMFLAWILCIGFLLFAKLDRLGHLSKYLSVGVFILIILLESSRLYLGYFGNLTCRVAELANFFMLTISMQMPLLGYFLFNPYLLNTPTEVILHTILWIMSCFEIFLSYFALKNATSLAQMMYLRHLKREGERF